MGGDQSTQSLPLVSLGRGIAVHWEAIDAEGVFSLGDGSGRNLLLKAEP
jgi:hypothetical protein